MSRTAQALTDRSAHASILGYCYQFDRTILEILSATNGSQVLVEGLEDIDVLDGDRSTAIQVKYWGGKSQKYATPRSIHEPVTPMLEAYARGVTHDFILHVYFGVASSPPAQFTVDDLRSCLTRRTRATETEPAKTHLDYEKYSDEVLEGFVKKLQIRIGDDFDTQNKAAKTELARHLSAKDIDVTDLYYATALECVQTLAMKPEGSNRKITREEFLSRINTRDALYNRWHAETIGIDRYTAALAKVLRTQKTLAPSKIRALVLSIDAHMDEAEELAHRLATSEFGPAKLHTTKPWTLVLQADSSCLLEFKRRLLDRDIQFNDGYESIAFSSDAFASEPLINTKRSGNSISKASYAIRVVSLESFGKFVARGHKVGVILAPDGVNNSLFRSASSDPPVFYQGLKAKHLHTIIGGSR